MKNKWFVMVWLLQKNEHPSTFGESDLYIVGVGPKKMWLKYVEEDLRNQ